MMSRLYRNIRNRSLFKRYELKQILYKYLLTNRPFELPEDARKSMYVKQFLLPRHSSKSYARNLCFMSGRARSVSRAFRLNRSMIKQLSSQKILPGIKRSSW